MLKKTLTSLMILSIMAPALYAQILTPVHWSYAAKEISPNEAVVFLKATIDDGWHIYSQHVKEGGPVKTTFVFNRSNDFFAEGETIEPKPITRLEQVFGMEVSFFETSVIFQQKIKLKKNKVTVIGHLEYMTCNDQKCLPPEEVNFTIDVK